MLTINQLSDWLKLHQKRLACGDPVPTLSDIADMACISRQTLYKVIQGDRTQFGRVVQVRLNVVIGRIVGEPSYQHSKMARVDLSRGSPRIKFGV